jgi:hypothetical protein
MIVDSTLLIPSRQPPVVFQPIDQPLYPLAEAVMDIPVQLCCGVGLLLNRSKEASPDARLAPAVEAASDGGPAAIPLGEVAPGSPCTDDPQNAIEDASVISRQGGRCEDVRPTGQGGAP